MDLVILAAGMGSRFGGLKQLQPITENQEFIIDFSVYDAIKCGFDRVVFIIKKENEILFKDTIGKRLEKYVEVKYVFQELEDIPKGFNVPMYREKPWGTAQAIYACRNEIFNNFVVINADDFYGRDSFYKAAKICKNNLDITYCLIGYSAINTIPETRIVKRGVCQVENGYLKGIVESKINKLENGILAVPLNDPSKQEIIQDDTVVSMNMFCFSSTIFDFLEKYFIDFMNKEVTENPEKSEFLLPDVIDKMCKKNQVSVKVEKTTAKWQGVTYREDLQGLIESIKQLQTSGEYPSKLF